MEFKEQWEALKALGGDSTKRGRLLDSYENFVEALLAADEGVPFGGNLDEEGREEVLGVLHSLVDGNVLAVGRMRQIELVLLASLFFLAQGKRVLVLSGMPVEASVIQERVAFLGEKLGIDLSLGVRPPAKGAKTPEFVGDLILADYIQLVRACHVGWKGYEERPTVALFCEIDLCLYDGRIFFFGNRQLRAVAGVYRSTGKDIGWPDPKGVVDFKDLAGNFDALCGVTSYLPPTVRSELLTVYSPSIKNVITHAKAPPLVPLVFRTREEKYDALCNDIIGAEGHALIFFAHQPTHQALSKKLADLGQTTVPIRNIKDFASFLNADNSKKRIAFFPGFPHLAEFTTPEGYVLNVFIAEHYPMLHHHTKVQAFTEQTGKINMGPWLYCSLEDEMISAYASDQDFSASFNLIEFAEQRGLSERLRAVVPKSMAKKAHTRLVRSWVARFILRKVHHMWRANITEEFPILRVGYPTMPAQRPKGMKKKIGKHLESPCFCGSGKPFKECHGKITT